MRIILLFTIATLAAGQAPEQSGETFKSGVTVIQVPVVVRDRDGHTVGNLEKDDFQLFDNGKRVEIASFSVEKPGSQTAPDRSLEPGANTHAIDIPERFTAYFFDDRNLGAFADMTRIRDAAAKQFGALQRGDRVAIYSSSCYLMQDFTNDRAKLQEVISHLQISPPQMCRVSRAQVQQIYVLNDVIKRMANLPGRREIILVSGGFPVRHDNSHDTEDLIEAAARSKVTINALDTGANTESAGSGAANSQRPEEMARGRYSAATPIVLTDLARGTGGTYVTGNDFNFNFRRLATPESHYLLGFVPIAKADGKAHQLKVKLEKKGKFTVEARSDYYAPLP